MGNDRVGRALLEHLDEVPSNFREYERLFEVGRGCPREDKREILVVEDSSSREGGEQDERDRLLLRAVVTGCNTGDRSESKLDWKGGTPMAARRISRGAHPPRGLLASSFTLALLALASDASAFCRSTTCRGDHCPRDDQGCPSTGAKLQWKTACISFSFQKAGTQNLDLGQAKAAVTRAFQHWSEVKCADGTTASLTFSPTEDVACKKSQYNPNGKNVNVVLFQDTDWTYRGIDGTLAKTSVTYNDETGEIYDADIEINAANNPLTVTDPPKPVKYDLEAIMTHEVGHFIGLAHSPERDAVMYASYAPGSTSQRRLTADDVDAICTVYPATRKASCDSEPRGGFGPTCDDEPAKSGCSLGGGKPADDFAEVWPAAIAAGALAAILHRRRRNRSK